MSRSQELAKMISDAELIENLTLKYPSGLRVSLDDLSTQDVLHATGGPVPAVKPPTRTPVESREICSYCKTPKSGCSTYKQYHAAGGLKWIHACASFDGRLMRDVK